MSNLYVVSMIFIAVALLFGDRLKVWTIQNNPSFIFTLGYTAVILGVFSAIYYLFFRNSKEGFFFEVSKCNPKCSGAYYGKPATFQFTPLSVDGTTCPDKNCGYGMISECDYPECQKTLQKYGGVPPQEML